MYYICTRTEAESNIPHSRYPLYLHVGLTTGNTGKTLGCDLWLGLGIWGRVLYRRSQAKGGRELKIFLDSTRITGARGTRPPLGIIQG